MKNTTLDLIAEEIGYSATRTLHVWCGAGGLSIPCHAKPDHPLAAVIGLPAWTKMVAAFGPDRLEIPSFESDEIDVRKRNVVRMVGEGVSPKEAAEKAGVSLRRVQQILKEFGVENPQGKRRGKNAGEKGQAKTAQEAPGCVEATEPFAKARESSLGLAEAFGVLFSPTHDEAYPALA
jgi:Homeodomain-like domain